MTQEFMSLHVTPKGALYSADCRKCGQTIYSHEWAHGYNNDTRDALEDGTAPCSCCHGTADPETFYDCGRQYAARYSADGYTDCTEWNYGKNKRQLIREVKALYSGE